MRTAASVTQQAGRQMQSGLQPVQATITGISASIPGLISSLGSLAGAFGLAFGAKQVFDYATAFTDLQNRLKLVTTSTTQLGDATDSVFKIALQTSQSVESVAEVFQRFAQNAGALGLKLNDVSQLTTTVAKAVALSGASAESARAGLVQFGQALASGTLRGDELNSVLEQLPALATAIAKGMNISVGSLRALGAAGKLTSADVIKALRNVSAEVDQLFATRQITLPQAFEDLQTALTRFVGEGDKALGVSNGLANALDAIAQAIGGVNINSIVEPLQTLKTVVNDVWDALSGFFGRVRDAAERDFPALTSAIADAFKPARFTDFVVATAKEIDTLVEVFTGSFGAIDRVLSAVADNIKNYFSNALNSAGNAVTGWVNNQIDSLNKLTGFIQFDKIGGGDKQTNAPIYSLADSAKAGYDAAKVQLNWAQTLTQQTNQNYFLMMTKGLQNTDDALRTSAGVSAAVTKSKVTDGERLVKSMQEQLDGMGKLQTKYAELQAKIDSGGIKFDNPAQQNYALGLAAAQDLIADQEKSFDESQKKAKELSKVWQGSTDQMTQFALQAARNIQDSLGDTLYDVLTGNFDDIGTAFLQMLTKMATQAAAANIGQYLFGDYGNTKQIGGLLGSVFGSLFGSTPTATASTVSSTAISADWGSAGSSLMYAFATGGYTGDGAKTDVAGYVHKGEYVINADAVDRLGLGFLQSLNGYSQGGAAGMPSGPIAGLTSTTGNVNVEVNVSSTGQVSTSGADQYKSMGKLVGELVRNEIQTQQIRSLRQGGTLWKANNGMVNP